MDYTLSNIDSDKKDRIINAAIEEFSLYPYDKASTNNIVKNAGISKGLLFHYFESKQELYDKLVGFVINKLYNEISSQIKWDEKDILERIKHLIVVKMKIGKKYPHMFDFIIKVLSYKKSSSVDDVMDLYGKYGVDFQVILSDIYTKNIDYSLFRKPEDVQKNINIFQWTLEKYSEEKLLNLSETDVLDYDEIIVEIDEYLNILKSTFYN